MLLNHVLLSVFWLAYCVLHSVLAAVSSKNFFRKSLGSAYRHYRLAYTLFAFAGLVAVVWFQLSIASSPLFSPTAFTYLIGGAIAGSGLLMMLVCIRKYFMNLSGLRSLVQQEVYTELVVSGVHRYVRHPLYLGTFAFIWGLLLLFPTVSLLLANSIITIYTLIGITLEEKKLVLDFGKAYVDYQKAVPKLIPKLVPNENSIPNRRQKQTIRR